MKAFIYWNLHKKCWSVRDQKTRKVVNHLTSLTLKDCIFKVSEAGRLRVLRERRKNVHAGVVGTVTDAPAATINNARSVRYNPYKQSHFTVDDTEVSAAKWVMFHPNRTVTVLGEVYS